MALPLSSLDTRFLKKWYFLTFQCFSPRPGRLSPAVVSVKGTWWYNLLLSFKDFFTLEHLSSYPSKAGTKTLQVLYLRFYKVLFLTHLKMNTVDLRPGSPLWLLLSTVMFYLPDRHMPFHRRDFPSVDHSWVIAADYLNSFCSPFTVIQTSKIASTPFFSWSFLNTEDTDSYKQIRRTSSNHSLLLIYDVVLLNWIKKIRPD